MALAQSAAAFAPNDETTALEFPLQYDVSRFVYESSRIERSEFGRSTALGAGWVVQRNEHTGVLHMAYGGDVVLSGGVASEAEAGAKVREFLLSQSPALGTRIENMELRNVFEYRGKYAVHYRQVVNGVPVLNASAFAVVAQSGQVVAFGSDFFPEGDRVQTNPAISESDAIDLAVRALGTQARADKPITANLVLLPAPQGELMALTPTWVVTFEANEPFGKWVSFVSGLSGEILGRRNDYHMVNVSGTVDAEVEDFGQCDGFGIQPMENLTVNVQGGGNGDSNDDGNYDITHAGASPITVEAELLGPFIDVNFVAGADASFSGTAVPGVPFQITWDGSNSRNDERDVFFHGNRAHDFMKDIDPSFTSLDYAMPSSVGNSTGICPGNAWWDGTGMNYCSAGTNGGTSYQNTGRIGNVVYHEYGHGVSQEWYQDNGSNLPSGDMHEGNADIIANFIDRNSITGIGFFTGNCTSGIRDADNSLQWPTDNNGGHFGGQIIAGFHWDAWQSLLATKPQAEADAIAFDTWHFGRGMGTPLNQADQVLWTFIADDDDANLDNGTPNYDHFCLGASNHNFQCPEILTGVIINHDKLGHTEDGSLGFQVVAEITSTEAALDPSELKLFYRVNGGGYAELLMTATGTPNEFGATIPAQSQNSEAEYYLFAQDMLGNSRLDPALAPAQVHAFDVAFEYDDLEGSVAGWTAGLPGDDATTGQWELIDPIPTAAQPGDDSTPDPGVLAFITGQCGGPNCSGGCTLGCNDIDGGTTTLLSPVYDLGGALSAKIKYDRWYSNNTGADPNNDNWVVDVSNDGGSTWTNFENTTASSASWTTQSIDINAVFGAPDLVQLRFRASDLNSGSLVEGGVDEIRVLADFGGVVDVSEAGAAEPIAFALSQNQPNPFLPATQIEYSVPSRSEIDLTVYNVRGQAVRTLASGAREAGSYSVRWDGRDGSGQRVAAGVYFYRLSAGSETLTRKMTVLK